MFTRVSRFWTANSRMPRFRFHEKHGDLIGAHISTKGGLHTVFERASMINASAIALFAKNSNQWKGKVMTDEDVALFAKLRNVKPILTHASYLINLATTNAEFHRKSIEALADELDRAERLGIHAVVLHPGAHLGAGARPRAEGEPAAAEPARHAGIGKVGAFHLNDSKKPLGSRVDRHQNIGEGGIAVDAFGFVLNDAAS